MKKNDILKSLQHLTDEALYTAKRDGDEAAILINEVAEKIKSYIETQDSEHRVLKSRYQEMCDLAELYAFELVYLKKIVENFHQELCQHNTKMSLAKHQAAKKVYPIQPDED